MIDTVVRGVAGDAARAVHRDRRPGPVVEHATSTVGGQAVHRVLRHGAVILQHEITEITGLKHDIPDSATSGAGRVHADHTANEAPPTGSFV